MSVLEEKQVSIPSDLDKRIVIPWVVLAVAFGLSCAVMLVDLIVSRKADERAFLRRADNVLSVSNQVLMQSIEKSEVILGMVESEFGLIFRSVQEPSVPKVAVEGGAIEGVETEVVDGASAEDLLIQEKLASINSVNLQLKDIVARHQEVQLSSLRMINEKGDVVFHASDSGVDSKINVKDRNYFYEMSKDGVGGVKVFPPVELALSKKWVIPVSKRINAKGGGFSGVVVLFLRGEHFGELFRNLEAGEKSAFSLMGKDGEVVSISPEESLPIEKRVNIDDVFRGVSSGEIKGLIEKNGSDGGGYLVKYVSQKDSPLILVSLLSESDMFDAWRQKAWVYLVSVILISFMLGALWKLSNQRKSDVEKLKIIEKSIEEERAKGEDAVQHVKRVLRHVLNSASVVLSSDVNVSDGGRFALSDKSKFSLLGLSGLDYARVFGEKGALEVAEPFDVAELCAMNVDKFSSRVNSVGIKLSKELSHEGSRMVIGPQSVFGTALELLLCVVAKRIDLAGDDGTNRMMDIEVKTVQTDDVVSIRINSGNASYYADKEWEENKKYIKLGGISDSHEIIDLHLSMLVQYVSQMGGTLECDKSGDNMWFVVNLQMPVQV